MIFSIAAEIRLRMILLKTACERPVTAVPKIPSLWKLDNSASFPSLWGVFNVPYLLQNLTEDLGCHNVLSFQHLQKDSVFTRYFSIFYRGVNSFVAPCLLAEQQLVSSCIKILILSLNAIHNDTNVSVT